MKQTKIEQMADSRFDCEVYKDFNQDLKHLNDQDLRNHFNVYGKTEPRIYAKTSKAVEQISVKWLRGHGIEVGAGDIPCPLYGTETRCDYADLSIESKFGSDNVNLLFNLNIPFDKDQVRAYDFAIASHVLEHVDSFLVAFENLIQLVKPSGIVYITLPCKDNDLDGHWLPDHGFEHHIQEYNDLLRYSQLHHDDFVAFVKRAQENPVVADAILTRVLRNDRAMYDRILQHGLVNPEDRYVYHKHSYSFHGWTDTMIKTAEYFCGKIQLLDARFGHDRMDGHFVFRKLV